ncbi:hypothetical protein D3C77_631710 [compost metagenome]
MQISATDITTLSQGAMRPASSSVGSSTPCSWLMLANRPTLSIRINTPRPRPPRMPPTAAALGCLVRPPITASMGKPTAMLNEA